jgi:hypothetical protein
MKRNPLEIRGPNLKFLWYFVRYRLRYRQTASYQTNAASKSPPPADPRARQDSLRTLILSACPLSPGGARIRGSLLLSEYHQKTPIKATILILHHHKSLLMGAPPVFTSLLHRSGISIMRARISSIVILSHSS